MMPDDGFAAGCALRDPRCTLKLQEMMANTQG
jgi:hypothetical protein